MPSPTTLSSFVSYCEAHPEQRFWQALRNWANEHYPKKKRSHILRANLTEGEGFKVGHFPMDDTFEMD